MELSQSPGHQFYPSQAQHMQTTPVDSKAREIDGQRILEARIFEAEESLSDEPSTRKTAPRGLLTVVGDTDISGENTRVFSAVSPSSHATAMEAAK